MAALALATRRRSASLAAQEGDLAVGGAVPAVTVADLSGRSVRLAPAPGKPMLIEFWATWCPVCEKLEPTMKAMHAKYGSRVQFAAIAVNVNESSARVVRHVTQRSLAYPVYFDASGTATNAFDVPATSYVVIVDRNGKVAYTGTGRDAGSGRDIAPSSMNNSWSGSKCRA